MCSDNEEYVGTAGFKARGKQAGRRKKKEEAAAAAAAAAGGGGGGADAEVAAGVAGMSVAAAPEGAAAEDGENSDSDLDSEEEAKLL